MPETARAGQGATGLSHTRAHWEIAARLSRCDADCCRLWRQVRWREDSGHPSAELLYDYQREVRRRERLREELDATP